MAVVIATSQCFVVRVCGFGDRFFVVVFDLVSPLNQVAGTGGQKEADTHFCMSYQATSSQCFLACASVLL